MPKLISITERPRHPEKAHKPDNPSPRKPAWLKVRAPGSAAYFEVRALMRRQKLHTVCEEAACPNMGECWTRRHATFIILGDTCTRACAFCNVRTGKPDALDEGEPDRLAESVANLGLTHVVITSVDRDDLPDGGAEQFARSIDRVRERAPGTTVEVLTPDFRGKAGALDRVVAARPDVFNHNLETVPRFYRSVRPGADYARSLALLRRARSLAPALFTKSGIMVGLGETPDEVYALMDDLRAADVDFLTMGQYLQPTLKHARVERYVPPDELDAYAEAARRRGFLAVAATPLTRSSYHAGRDFERLRAAREARQAGARRTENV